MPRGSKKNSSKSTAAAPESEKRVARQVQTEERQLRIDGASGLNGIKINGFYDDVQEKYNGKPVYQKRIHPEIELLFGGDGVWYVGEHIEDDDEGYRVVRLAAHQKRVDRPWKGTSWKVLIGSKLQACKVIIADTNALLAFKLLPSSHDLFLPYTYNPFLLACG